MAFHTLRSVKSFIQIRIKHDLVTIKLLKLTPCFLTF